MLIPVYILTVLAAVARCGADSRASRTCFSDWLEPIVYGGVPMLEPSDVERLDRDRSWPPAPALIGILAAAAHLGQRPRPRRSPFPRPLAILSERKFFWDELYHYAFYVPAVWLSVHAAPHHRAVGAAARARRARRARRSRRARTFAVVQNGLVRVYALVFALGVAGLVFYFMVQAA